MYTIDDLRAARRKLDMAFLAYSSLEVPKAITLLYRIRAGEEYVAKEQDPERKQRYISALEDLRDELNRALADKLEARRVRQFKDLQDAFEQELERYMEVVRWALGAGVYKEWCEQETIGGDHEDTP